MRSLPEKIGFVGGDNIDHMNDLLMLSVITKHIIAILRVSAYAICPQTFSEPAFKHCSFLGRHFDSIVRVNEFTQSEEIFIAQCFLVIRIELKSSHSESF